MDKDFEYQAIYFRMGCYNRDDGTPGLIGFDCPFDDSPVLYAGNKEELELKVRAVHAGALEEVVNLKVERDWDGADWEGVYPDLVCDKQGNIQIDLYRKITADGAFHPDLAQYSFGRETLTQLWEREKWRWIDESKKNYS